jgi:hypothetical protein
MDDFEENEKIKNIIDAIYNLFIHFFNDFKKFISKYLNINLKQNKLKEIDKPCLE